MPQELRVISSREEARYTCVDCHKTLPISAFYTKKDSKRGHFAWCKRCHNKRTKLWHESNRALHLGLVKARKFALKQEAIVHYGGKCACCGETEIKFLELDHVNNDGCVFRKNMGKWLLGADLVRWLKRNDWPGDIQLLCSNCNAAKSRYGACPHQEGKDARA